MYVTVAELRSAGVTPEEASDERLAQLIELATQIVDSVCHQHFEPTEGTFVTRGHGNTFVDFEGKFLLTPVSVLIDGEAFTEFDNHGRFLILRSRAPTNSVISVVGRWGRFETVPAPIKQAVIEIVLDEVRPTRKSKYWVQSERLGDYSYTRTSVQRPTEIDNPTAWNLIKPYIYRPTLVGSPKGPTPITPTLGEV